MSSHDWKPCGECGTLLQKNKFGDYDCPGCNIENFLFPFRSSKEEVKEKPIPQNEEKELAEVEI